MITSTSQIATLFTDPRISDNAQRLFFNTNNPKLIRGSMLYESDDSKKWMWVETLLHGMGDMEYTVEGNTPHTDEPRQGYSRARAVSQFSIAVELTQFTVDVAEPGLMKLIFDSLENSYWNTLERQYAAHYSYSLEGVTIPTVGGRPIVDSFAIDGLAYFHRSHTFLSNTSITNSNLSSPARTQWSQTARRGMIAQTRAWLADNNLPMLRKARGWAYGDNIDGAFEVSEKSEKDPESNKNALNVAHFWNFGKGASQGYYWPLMGADEFMLCMEPESPELPGLTCRFLKGQRREKIDYQPPDKQRRVIGVRMRNSVFGSDPYCQVTSRANV